MSDEDKPPIKKYLSAASIDFGSFLSKPAIAYVAMLASSKPMKSVSISFEIATTIIPTVASSISE